MIVLMDCHQDLAYDNQIMTVFIHIGLPKTGTTAVQWALLKNIGHLKGWFCVLLQINLVSNMGI